MSKKPMKANEDEDLKRKASRFEELQDLENQAAKLELDFLEKKSIAQQAKRAYESAVEKLRKRIHEPTDLLFSPAEEAEPWRDVTLDGLGLVGQLADKLIAAEIETLGAIADYTAVKPLTEIPGVGAAAAGKIETAVEKYWQAHPLQEETVEAA